MEEKYSILINYLLAIVLLACSLLIENREINGLLLGGFFATALSGTIGLVSWILGIRKKLKTVFAALFIKKLRVSCSYLYSIKVDGYYLLVKSRKHGKYQPVGGNFKRNKNSHHSLNKLEAKPDDKFNNGGRSSDDLRLFIKGYKLSQFIKWYNAPNKEREVSYDREFFEELVEPGIFPSHIFKYPIITFHKQIVTPVRFSNHLNCYEVHIYDIVELDPTTEQLEFTKTLKQEKGDTDEYKWASFDTISNQGYQGSEIQSPYTITDHSKEILI